MNEQFSDRFKDDRTCFRQTLFVCHAGGKFERHFRRVNVVIRTVNKRRFQPDNGIARKHAFLCAFAKPLFNCGVEVLRNGTAEYLFSENKVYAVVRLKSDMNVAVLSVSAGLFLIFALLGNSLSYCFSVSDFRCSEIYGNAVFRFQFRHDNVYLRVAERRDNGFFRFGVGLVCKRRVFLAEFRKA